MSDSSDSALERLIKFYFVSPFWRYYIVSFVFVHWKIWLYVFSDKSVENKITGVQEITLSVSKCFFDYTDGYFMSFLESFVYMIALPLITSLTALFILRIFERWTAPWHKKHEQKVVEKITNAKTEYENIRDKYNMLMYMQEKYSEISEKDIFSDDRDKLKEKLLYLILETTFNDEPSSFRDLYTKIEKDIGSWNGGRLDSLDFDLTKEIQEIIIHAERLKYIIQATFNANKYKLDSKGRECLLKLSKKYHGVNYLIGL